MGRICSTPRERRRGTARSVYIYVRPCRLDRARMGLDCPRMDLTVDTQVVAVDWSGDATRAGQRRHIWAAVARRGELVQLRNGRVRDEVVDSLVAAAGRHEDL